MANAFLGKQIVEVVRGLKKQTQRTFCKCWTALSLKKGRKQTGMAATVPAPGKGQPFGGAGVY
jgi:hypothetical protein